MRGYSKVVTAADTNQVWNEEITSLPKQVTGSGCTFTS